MNYKELYETPSAIVVDVKMEGVICQSGLNGFDNPADYINGGDPFAF